ncbi:MrpH family fimbial adhesin [Vibrio sagamiensis]|uniref:Fimbrial adhesin MrpH C-terminal domain-containing protein n=1 Tax=Vibrio sagamiensis NBRC 104589 TaxID=1219064 RepID=A0A511QBV4_9VIBR|nr:hypothetical protein [Vibrio sagamiensis]PNQ53994.1 hypothetical protein C1141_18270 [Vibrio agarivorans]GEM74783.1 hypothetical protein VSA01S_08950 [Vibrio sagamiensis NBRC 104589]
MRIKLLLFLLSISTDINAGWQNFLFVSPYKGNWISTPVTINDKSGEARMSVTFPKTSRMDVLDTRCSDNSIDDVYGTSTFWIQYPSSWQTDKSSGLKYLINSNWTTSYGVRDVPNWSTRISRKTFYFELNKVCWNQSDHVGVIIPASLSSTSIFTVKIKSEAARPGVYNLQFPFRWMYEESKQSGNGPSYFNEWAAETLARDALTWYGSFWVTVTSQCKLSSYNTINLEHGEMTAAEAKRNKTRPHSINISCKETVPVKLKLTGNIPVSGKTANFTQCGIGGSCELLFDNDKSEKNITISKSSSTNVSITSTYHPTDIIKEGSFSGSGTLTFLVM